MSKATLQDVAYKMDWEGWPEVLEWFHGEDDIFDKEFSQLWYDAQQAYGILNGYHRQILNYFAEHDVDTEVD